MTVPRNLRQRRRRRRRKMSTKITTTTTDTSAEYRWYAQGIGDKDGGGRGSTTAPVDWQQQWGVDYPCYCVATSNTVSSLSCCCLVLIYFSSGSLPPVYCKKYYQYCNHEENIFFTKCTWTLLIYPPHIEEQKIYEFSWSIKTYVSP